MRSLRMELFSKSLEDLGDSVNAHFMLMIAQHFQESAHVGSFEVMRKVHGQLEGSDCMLLLSRSIENANRILDVADANLIDGDVAVVFAGLDIDEGCGLCFSSIHSQLGFTVHGSISSAYDLRCFSHHRTISPSLCKRMSGGPFRDKPWLVFCG